MMNTGADEYFGITTGRITPGLVNMFSEHHVISLFANAAEAISFKDPDQKFAGNRARLWHGRGQPPLGKSRSVGLDSTLESGLFSRSF